MPKLHAILGLLMLALLVGCSNTYRGNFVSAYRFGNFPAANAQLQNEAGGALKNQGDGDRLIYLLEQGAVLRAAGDLEGSNRSFEAADEMFQKYDQKASVRLGKEVTAAITNQTQNDYEGYGYDRIMMNAYKAMNYLELGNADFARAELKRVAYAQQMIEMHKASRIADMEAQKKQNSKYNVDRAMHDPRFNAQTQAVYGSLPDNQAKANYVNAFAEYLQGVFYLHCGDSSDLELARAALKSALSMVPNDYVQQDLSLVERISETGVREPITYVIFETGLAPRRDQIRIDIPVWIVNIAAHDTGVDYVGAAFPTLQPEPGGMPFIQANATTGNFRTQLLVDMDAVVAREFKDELSAVITRTLISSGTKAAVAYAAHKATESDGLLNLVTRIGTTIYQYSQNDADLRTWRTLPKMINVARFPTPADGAVTLTSPMGSIISTVRVQAGKTNFIWVRMPGEAAPAVHTTVMQCQ